jgi:hypothetical protein
MLPKKVPHCGFLKFELQRGDTNEVPTGQTAYGHREVLISLELFGLNISRVIPTTRSFITDINHAITGAMPKTQFANLTE